LGGLHERFLFFCFTSEADGCFANFLALKIMSIERADLTGEIKVEPVENNEEMRNPLTARASLVVAIPNPTINPSSAMMLRQG
jgi:hypothetical protein